MSIRPPRTLAISAPGVELPALDPWLWGVRRAGVAAVQMRCKRRDDRRLVALARRAREILGDSTLLLINGRPDIALLVDADGVHLPASGLPAPAARACLGRSALLGRSTHSVDEIRAAGDDGTDYVTFGPIYSTPGKESYGPPQGLRALERAVLVGPRVLALGGITTIERIRQCGAAGAWGIAGIRQFGDPAGAAACVTAVDRDFGHHDND